MKKIYTIVTIIIHLVFGSELVQYNAQGDAFGGVVSVFGENGNAVAGNPALLGKAEKRTLAVTSALAGLAMDNDSVVSFLAQGTIPIKQLAGTLGVNASILLNNITTEKGSALLFSKWNVLAGYGFSLSSKFQMGVNASVKGTYANDEYLEEGEEGGTIPLKVNITAGMNIRPSRLLSISLLAANILSYITSVEYLDDDPGIIRGAVGLYIQKLKIGAAADYAIYEKKISFDAAVKLSLLQDAFRAIVGCTINNYKGGVVPKIALGTTLGKLTIDYGFAYPVSGVFTAGNHIISLGLIY
jgi:hypothetical protein